MSLIKCFLNRARKLSSTQELFNDEVEKIRRIFEANGYPKQFIDANISTFLEETVDDNTAEQNVRSEEKFAYMVLPYVGKSSLKLQRRIRNELDGHGLRIISAYRTTKVGS